VPLSATFRALKHRALLTLGLAALFYNFGFFTLLAYTPFPLHMGAHELGLVFFGWGLALALTSVLLAPAVKHRFGTSRTLGAALAGFAAILVAMAVGASTPAVLVAGVIVAGGFLGVVNTVLTEAVMANAPVERPIASAAYSFVRFAGGAIAPWLAGRLAEDVAPDAPFWVGAFAVIIAVGCVAAARSTLAERAEPRTAVAEALAA